VDVFGRSFCRVARFLISGHFLFPCLYSLFVLRILGGSLLRLVTGGSHGWVGR
jgi:hypothetical protein